MSLRDSFVILAACAAGYLGGVLSSQPPAAASSRDVVRASRFELVNGAGAVVAGWEAESNGAVRLNFLHDQRTSIALGTLTDGRPFLRMDGQDGKNRISLDLVQGDKPLLVMSDERWEGRVHLGFMTPDTFPYSNWDHWGLLFRAVGSEHAVAGMGMTNTRSNPAEPFLRIAGRSIR